MGSRKVWSGVLALVGYVSAIFGANYAIGHWGTACFPGGPCTIPVGFGLVAPSGVLFVGAALFLRDLVQDRMGRGYTMGAIVLGVLLTLLVESPALALASAAAFLLGESADFFVYTPLRARHYHWQGVLASGVVGSLVDSAVFLWLAFGSLGFLAGQFVGKVEITALCALLVLVRSLRREAPMVSGPGLGELLRGAWRQGRRSGGPFAVRWLWYVLRQRAELAQPRPTPYRGPARFA